MDLSAYISEERPLAELLDLLDSPGTTAFFDAEDEVLNSLPANRHSAERIMEYLYDFDSVTAWEILVERFWVFLSSDEQNSMRKKAYMHLDGELVDSWFERKQHRRRGGVSGK